MNENTQKFASFWVRLVAWLIDLLILILFYLYLITLLVSETSVQAIIPRLVADIVLLTVFSALVFPMVNILMTSIFGGGIGKLLSGIEIQNQQGNKLSVKRAFLRNYLGYLISGVLVNLGYFWILIDENKQAWHDMIAGSYVVVKRNFMKLVGLVFLLLLICLNIFVLSQIIGKVNKNSKEYVQIFDDARIEFQQALTVPQTNVEGDYQK